MFISLNNNNFFNIKQSNGLILIFTEGTILGPKRIWNFFCHKKYVPIGDCINKIKNWQNDGWNISYLTSRKSMKQVHEIKAILKRNNFPGCNLYFRGAKEKYRDIAEELIPNILIEDDCHSIGGKFQMTITYVDNNIRKKIKSIIVKEFRGIDHLPDNVSALLKVKSHSPAFNW